MLADIFVIVLGLIFGSFITALVWRIHEQEEVAPKQNKKKDTSIVNGRSMCPTCGHQLAARDLIPLFSWLISSGRCRYCKTNISFEYPLTEIGTAILFLLSYFAFQPFIGAYEWLLFVIWLAILICLIALAIYDLKWYLLPNRIVYPLTAISLMYALISLINGENLFKDALMLVLSVLVAGGLFYALYQISQGRWIGGGDVKLGWAIGLILGYPAKSFLMLFLASLLGTIVALPLMTTHKLNKKSIMPFGPFLIVSTMIVVLYGSSILNWYQTTFILV